MSEEDKEAIRVSCETYCRENREKILKQAKELAPHLNCSEGLIVAGVQGAMYAMAIMRQEKYEEYVRQRMRQLQDYGSEFKSGGIVIFPGEQKGYEKQNLITPDKGVLSPGTKAFIYLYKGIDKLN